MHKWRLLILLFFLFFVYNPEITHSQTIPNEITFTEVNINLWKNKLFLIENGEIVHSYNIAPGKSVTPTPIGDFRVVEKGVGWGGGFGSHWLGLNVPFGKYGIHGTNKPHLIGRNVSSGCIRLRNPDIHDLFSKVEIGTPVRIDGPILGKEGLEYRILVRGSKGSLVQLVQNRLKSGEYYNGKSNGVFDWETEMAVKKYQRENSLEVTGQIHFPDLVALGLIE